MPVKYLSRSRSRTVLQFFILYDSFDLYNHRRESKSWKWCWCSND